MVTTCSSQVPIIMEQEDLSRHTSFRIGGPAEFFSQPRNCWALVNTMRRCRAAGLPVRILGNGTNLLVRDEGVRGLVIATRSLRGTTAQGDSVTANCGVGLPHLLRLAEQNGLSGLEPLAGIPGSLGGAIKTNAGTPARCIADLVRCITLLTRDGDVTHVAPSQAGFGYRRSQLDGATVLSATLKLKPSDPERVARLANAYRRKKTAAQPTRANSAGCVFRNPHDDSAARIIDSLGLKGTAVGDAEISQEHANFIVNRNWARAADVLALIKLVQDAVFDALGITLELEIETW